MGLDSTLFIFLGQQFFFGQRGQQFINDDVGMIWWGIPMGLTHISFGKIAFCMPYSYLIIIMTKNNTEKKKLSFYQCVISRAVKLGCLARPKTCRSGTMSHTLFTKKKYHKALNNYIKYGSSLA